MENTLTPDDVCTWMIPLYKPDLSGSEYLGGHCQLLPPSQYICACIITCNLTGGSRGLGVVPVPL